MLDDRLQTALVEQVDFLRASAERFDQGYDHEVKRLALTMRVLHDTGGSSSLLGQLGLKSKLAFFNTRTGREPPPGRQVMEQLGWPTGMVMLSMTVGSPMMTFRAALGSDQQSQPAEVPFDAWWNEPLQFRRTAPNGIVVGSSSVLRIKKAERTSNPSHPPGGATCGTEPGWERGRSSAQAAICP